IRVNMSTSYTPEWTNYGIGSTLNYNVERTVLIG
ncbi:MAG: pilus assembly protein, partial [Betaproteobacteria bacterium]|nr:pilus assembly protein [Betaproteobacteria bacterium]